MKLNIKNISLDNWIVEMISVAGTLGVIGLGLVGAVWHVTLLSPFLLASVVGVIYFARKDQSYMERLVEEANEILDESYDKDSDEKEDK